MQLISYGLGDKFELEKFKAIKNIPWIKPEGGLWASPIDSPYGWKQWGCENLFGDFTSQFEFTFKGSILIIDAIRDLRKLTWNDTYPNSIDFEALQRAGHDAIWLTAKGERDTRFSRPYSLYGWDCESVIILNPTGITQWT